MSAATATTIDQTFLQGLGITAPPTLTVVQPSTEPIDDPAIWIESQPDKLAEALLALMDEYTTTLKRIGEGERYIADMTAQGKPVPTTWTMRLHNLITRRDDLQNQIVSKRMEVADKAVTFVEPLEMQWAWLWGAQPDDRVAARDADLVAEREAIYFRMFERYQAYYEAIYATSSVTGPAVSDAVADPAEVSWVRAWAQLRELGFTKQSDVETAIGGWSNEPQEVVRRAKTAKVKPKPAASDLPVRTIAQVKEVMNQIALEDGMSEQFDALGRKAPRA